MLRLPRLGHEITFSPGWRPPGGGISRADNELARRHGVDCSRSARSEGADDAREVAF
jgi:hypothetical protein